MNPPNTEASHLGRWCDYAARSMTTRRAAKYQTLTESLEELERTDPKVAEAKRKYNDMVDRWRFRKELGLDQANDANSHDSER